MAERPESVGVSRRRVAAGIAWSVPAIAVATRAPAFAASPGITVKYMGAACKLPGDSCQTELGVTKGYAIRTQICSTSSSPVTVTFENATVWRNGVKSTVMWDVEPDTVQLPAATPGQPVSQDVVIAIEGEPNSDNSSLRAEAPYVWETADGAPGTGVFSAFAATTPPCNNCGF